MKILLVDGQVTFGENVSVLFGPNHHLTAANNPRDAYSLLTQERPDVVVLDQTLSEIDSTTLLKHVRALPNPPPVLMLSADDDPQLVAPAQTFDDTKYSSLKVEAPGEAILIDAAYQATPAVSAPQISGQISNKNVIKNLGITEREIDVLALMVSGLSNKSIAKQLGIAESTVKTHLKSLFQTLRVKNRVACYNKARQLGLLPTIYNANFKFDLITSD